MSRISVVGVPSSAASCAADLGPTLDQVAEALTAATRDQRMRTLSVGELNPTRCAGDPAALARFVTSITRILAATIH